LDGKKTPICTRPSVAGRRAGRSPVLGHLVVGEDEILQQTHQLQRPVALDGVTGTVDDLHPEAR
jgi:hypothetical protein